MFRTRTSGASCPPIRARESCRDLRARRMNSRNVTGSAMTRSPPIVRNTARAKAPTARAVPNSLACPAAPPSAHAFSSWTSPRQRRPRHGSRSSVRAVPATCEAGCRRAARGDGRGDPAELRGQRRRGIESALAAFCASTHVLEDEPEKHESEVAVERLRSRRYLSGVCAMAGSNSTRPV